MSGRLVVKRYVRALYETAEEKGLLNDVREDVAVLEKILKEAPAIRAYCLTPHTDRGQERTFVNLSFIPYVSVLTGRMLTALCKNGRLAAIPFIHAAFAEIEEQRGDTISAELESAEELSPDVVDMLIKGLMRRSGKKIRLHLHVLPELLGGFRIMWQNRMLDMSVRGRIKKMRMVLKQGRV